jgi:hypothetical protein
VPRPCIFSSARWRLKELDGALPAPDRGQASAWCAVRISFVFPMLAGSPRQH